jgi:DNA-binding GntR family transcriptional regulator
LIAALRKHDSARARSVMEEHVLDGGKYLIETLEQRGVFADQQSKASASSS